MACKFLRNIFLFVMWFLPPMLISGHEILRKGEKLSLSSIGEGTKRVEVTAAPRKNTPTQGMGKSQWGVEWNDKNGCEYSIRLTWHNTNFGDITDHRYMCVQLLMDDSVLTTTEVHEGVDLYRGANSLKILLEDDGIIRWSIGSEGLAAVGEYRLVNAGNYSSFAVFTDGSDLNVFNAELTYALNSSTSQMTPFSKIEDFPSQSADNASPDGIWLFLDRDNDARWARLGGRYTLGIVQDAPEEWLIVYLDGAVTNSDRWQRGMKKGRLKSTPFMRHYNLEWIDASFDTLDMSDECSASLSEDGSILTLSFPLDHSIIRFYRPK